MLKNDEPFSNKEPIDGLVNKLRADERTAIDAAMELIQHGRNAVPYLIKALGDGDEQVRQKVIWPLWMIGHTDAVDELIAALEYDSDAKVRRYAACALGHIRDKRAINPLINAFGDTDPRVRWDAAIALAVIGKTAIDPLVVALQYGGEQVRLGAVHALGWLRDSRAVDSLMVALRDKDADIRKRAAFALGWIGDKRAAPSLIIALRDDNMEVKMQAAVCLGWLQDTRAVEPLIALLGDADEWLSYSAAEALGQIGSNEAVQALTFASQVSPSFYIRQSAREHLQRMGIDPDMISLSNPDTGRQQLWRSAEAMLTKRRCNLVIMPKV